MSSDLSTLESGTSQPESVSAISLSCATSTAVGSLPFGAGEEGGRGEGEEPVVRRASPLRRKRKAVRRAFGSPQPKRATGAAVDAGAICLQDQSKGFVDRG